MSHLCEHNRDWSAMPVDILKLISDCLPFVDYIKFRSVCKQWPSSPSDYSDLVNFPKDRPWLIIYELEKNRAGTLTRYIYSAFHPRYCTIKLHDLKDTTIVKSKFGWLVSHHGQFFLDNPLTFSRINLSKITVSGDYACTFTYLPANRECTLTVVNRMEDEPSLEFSMCRVGDRELITQKISHVSINHIGRAIKVLTCMHTHHHRHHLSTYSRCIAIYDLNNQRKYNFDTKGKILVYDYLNSERNTELVIETKLKDVQLKEMKSMQSEEWEQEFGGRALDLT